MAVRGRMRRSSPWLPATLALTADESRKIPRTGSGHRLRTANRPIQAADRRQSELGPTKQGLRGAGPKKRRGAGRPGKDPPDDESLARAGEEVRLGDPVAP